jgi:hypothetical protein
VRIPGIESSGSLSGTQDTGTEVCVARHKDQT